MNSSKALHLSPDLRNGESTTLPSGFLQKENGIEIKALLSPQDFFLTEFARTSSLDWISSHKLSRTSDLEWLLLCKFSRTRKLYSSPGTFFLRICSCGSPSGKERGMEVPTLLSGLFCKKIMEFKVKPYSPIRTFSH